MAKNSETEVKDVEAKVLDLSKSMERMKSLHADRDDVVVELNRSQLSRLELIARDLQQVFEQLPDDNDQFEFALTKGETPRLWIDMSTYVRMGAMPHQYELIKDTRMGRIILATSINKERFGQLVTDYMADKILERERLIEGEWISMSGYQFDSEEKDVAVNSNTVQPKGSHWRSFLWFCIGGIISLSSLFAWIWFGDLPTFLQ
ncbi:MAG: hypothetical protein GY761_19605 [Hyphomicrobiales bacterium]|nr:hypothetical protein [Hyphomicrobiales bacterium]